MDKSIVKISIYGEIELQVIQEGIRIFEKSNRGEAKFTVGKVIQVDNFFVIGEIAVFAQLLSIAFKVLIWIYKKTQKSKWDKEKFIGAIDNEMLKQGVVDYTIDEVRNFNCLLGETTDPCVVTVLSKTSGKGHKLLMFRDNGIFTIKIEKRIGIL